MPEMIAIVFQCHITKPYLVTSVSAAQLSNQDTFIQKGRIALRHDAILIISWFAVHPRERCKQCKEAIEVVQRKQRTNTS